MGKFKISKEELMNIAAACQERTFSEEIDLVEQSGGETWILDGIFTDSNKGLLCNDFEERLQTYGSNKKPVIEPKGYFEILLNALEDFTLRILLGAAIASIVIDCSTSDSDHLAYAWVEGFSILVAVMVCSNVTAVNDYQKER